MSTPLYYFKMEELISSQMSLLSNMKNLRQEYNSLAAASRDEFSLEQSLEQLEDYFNLFGKQHKMLLALPATANKQAYFENKIPMAGEDAYHHGKAHFKRIWGAVQSQRNLANYAQAPEPHFTLNRRHNLSPIQTPCKHRRHLRLRSLYTSSGNRRVHTQQSSTEKVAGESVSPNWVSSESGRFIATSLPSASTEVSKASEIVDNSHLESAHQSITQKREHQSIIRSLSTSGGDHGDFFQ